MGDTTKISWTDATFNGWYGCVRVSPGCRSCYADTDFAQRFHKDQPDLWRANGARVVTSAANWRKPAKWNREAAAAGEPRLVFCASLGDVFEGRDDLDEPRARLWDLIAATPWLSWQLLTKRPENVAGMVPWGEHWPANVLIGTSVEDQRRADERIPHLQALPARTRFLSVEPLLEPVALDLDGIHWAIVGGESGDDARPFDPDWARDIRRQCEAAGVGFFCKQLGTVWAAANGYRGNHQGDGQDPATWPEDLRVQTRAPIVDPREPGLFPLSA